MMILYIEIIDCLHNIFQMKRISLLVEYLLVLVG